MHLHSQKEQGASVFPVAAGGLGKPSPWVLRLQVLQLFPPWQRSGSWGQAQGGKDAPRGQAEALS